MFDVLGEGEDLGLPPLDRDDLHGCIQSKVVNLREHRYVVSGKHAASPHAAHLAHGIHAAYKTHETHAAHESHGTHGTHETGGRIGSDLTGR